MNGVNVEHPTLNAERRTEAPRARFHEGIIRKNSYKHWLIVRAQHALLRRGIELAHAGTYYFNMDDVEASLLPDDNTTSGCAVESLRIANVLERFRGDDRAAEVFFGERKSKNPSRNGAKIKLWKLTSVEVARTWMRENQVPPQPKPEQSAFALSDNDGVLPEGAGVP